MRVDQLLNKLCLVKSRSIAKKACDHGLVIINDEIAKASSAVSAGDVISYELQGRKVSFRLEKLPKGNVAKKDCPQYYTIITS